jgi:hypothetical protein
MPPPSVKICAGSGPSAMKPFEPLRWLVKVVILRALDNFQKGGSHLLHAASLLVFAGPIDWLGNTVCG